MKMLNRKFMIDFITRFFCLLQLINRAKTSAIWGN